MAGCYQRNRRPGFLQLRFETCTHLHNLNSTISDTRSSSPPSSNARVRYKKHRRRISTIHLKRGGALCTPADDSRLSVPHLAFPSAPFLPSPHPPCSTAARIINQSPGKRRHSRETADGLGAHFSSTEDGDGIRTDGGGGGHSVERRRDGMHSLGIDRWSSGNILLWPASAVLALLSNL